MKESCVHCLEIQLLQETVETMFSGIIERTIDHAKYDIAYTNLLIKPDLELRSAPLIGKFLSPTVRQRAVRPKYITSEPGKQEYDGMINLAKLVEVHKLKDMDHWEDELVPTFEGKVWKYKSNFVNTVSRLNVPRREANNHRLRLKKIHRLVPNDPEHPANAYAIAVGDSFLVRLKHELNKHITPIPVKYRSTSDTFIYTHP